MTSGLHHSILVVIAGQQAGRSMKMGGGQLEGNLEEGSYNHRPEEGVPLLGILLIKATDGTAHLGATSGQ